MENKEVIRRIIKIGNSEGVIIPKRAIDALKLKSGDRVEVRISKPGGSEKYIELVIDFNELEKVYRTSSKRIAKKLKTTDVITKL